MGRLALVDTAGLKTAPTTDTRLLKLCRQYLLGLAHLQKLRDKAATTAVIAAAVLRDPPDDPDAAALWRQCFDMTPASYLARGVASNERRLVELLTEIAETPSRTEKGLRARLEVFRAVLAQDDADRLLDAIVADCRSRQRS